MMSQSQYSLAWEAHVRNVCDGLCTLQQNGEFVDMTLAADGHMVKVHQVVLALASPYFKDLIISAQCPHPVIFLNKVTHPTLSAILEYIYTGEVLVSLEHLNDLLDAAKELHIKGLKDMKVHPTLIKTSKGLSTEQPTANILVDNELCFYQVTQEDNLKVSQQEQDESMQYNSNIMEFTTQSVYDDEQLCNSEIGQEMQNEQYMQDGQDMQDGEAMQGSDINDRQHMEDINVMQGESDLKDDGSCAQSIQGEGDSLSVPDDDTSQINVDCNLALDNPKYKSNPDCTLLQYTVSNRGSLQMILNRFLYYLKHTNRDKSRQWRCVDYLSHVAKCPAHVITKDDIVVQRIDMHTHPFHDKRILKKLKTGSIFSAIVTAEKMGRNKKRKMEDAILSDESRIE